jgi:hypothetical protein
MDERRDEWHRGVDENLASLNAGQRVWEREQKALLKLLREIDDDLRGSIGNETDGMIHRLRAVETAINMFRGIIDVDRAGNKGLVGRVEALEKRERSSDTRLKVWIAIIGLLSAFLSAAVFNLDKIEKILNRQVKSDPLEQMIDKVKHPKPRHRHYTIRPQPAEEPEAEE